MNIPQRRSTLSFMATIGLLCAACDTEAGLIEDASTALSAEDASPLADLAEAEMADAGPAALHGWHPLHPGVWVTTNGVESRWYIHGRAGHAWLREDLGARLDEGVEAGLAERYRALITEIDSMEFTAEEGPAECLAEAQTNFDLAAPPPSTKAGLVLQPSIVETPSGYKVNAVAVSGYLTGVVAEAYVRINDYVDHDYQSGWGWSVLKSAAAAGTAADPVDCLAFGRSTAANDTLLTRIEECP